MLLKATGWGSYWVAASSVLGDSDDRGEGGGDPTGA